MSSALVVQCFIKPDTLTALCRSLLRCAATEAVHLMFWSDAVADGERSARHRALNDEVRAVASAFVAAEGHRFASATLGGNDENRGTCATCRTALDHAFDAHEFAVFTEDDTIFTRDALRWFDDLHRAGLLDRDEVLALAGESIYFDSRRATPHDGYPAIAIAAAEARGLAADYVELGFVPSTCFATTRAKWARFGALRGQPRGDEDVCALCREQALSAIFPVVARVVDTGMLHQDGYSVRVLGADAVPEIKNTYVTADDLAPLTTSPRPFTGNLGRLFEASVLMTGFDPPAPPAATPSELVEALATPPAAPVIHAVRPWRLWCFSARNFGDALTPWLLRAHGVPFDLVAEFEEADLLGIGSNLDRVTGDHAPIVIWTSGFMYPKSSPVRYAPPVRLLGVRGQRTRAALTTAAAGDPVLGDAGLLVSRVFRRAGIAVTHELGVIPHMSDRAAAGRMGVASWPGTKMIDILDPIDTVLADIASCRRVVSSSLHGLVTADAFGIPSLYGVFTGGRDVEGDGFKFGDYSSALDYVIQGVQLDGATTRDSLIATVDARPSPDAAVLERVVDDLAMTAHILGGGARGLCTI